jgi:hypothetical protein
VLPNEGELHTAPCHAPCQVSKAYAPGSAYNQLAVICTYLPDEFSAVYYYFRALAIQVAFRGAPDILERYLRKAWERWQASAEARRKIGEGAERVVESWKRDYVVLIAILYRHSG